MYLVKYYNYIKIHDVIAKNTSAAYPDSYRDEAICLLRNLSPFNSTTEVSNQQFFVVSRLLRQHAFGALPRKDDFIS
jgi:hypothetical protein